MNDYPAPRIGPDVYTHSKEWVQIITKAQRRAIKRLYDRDPDGSTSYRQFRRRFRVASSYDPYVAIYPWCGMMIGIEPDGHTHS